MNIFDKDAFAKILIKAKGDMSINEYANKSGVSSAHISRFLRSMINTPPNPQTIKKLANYACNGVRYEDMMTTVGHIGMKDIPISKTSKLNALDIAKEYLSDNSNSWSEKEIFIKELTELYWKLKFK